MALMRSGAGTSNKALEPASPRVKASVGREKGAEMFSALDPWVDFDCPRCGASLRFRRVRESPSSAGSPNFLCCCPVCTGEIVLRQHQAFPDDWRWLCFVAPGMVACAFSIFIREMAWLVPFGVLLLGLGLLALVAYMIRQRWRWRCHVLPSEIVRKPDRADVAVPPPR
jgi:hypothetical protein